MEKANVNAKRYSLLTKGYFYLVILALLGIICLNNFSNIKFPPSMFLVVFFVSAMLCDRNELFALIVCCIPLSVGFQYKFGILICMAVYFVKFYKDFEFKLPIIFSFGFLIAWEGLHVVINNESLYFYLRDLFGLILCAFVVLTSLKYIDYPFIVRVFVLATIGILLIMLFEQLDQHSFNFKEIFLKGFRFGVNKQASQEYALAFNPNMLGFICNFGIAGLMQLILTKKFKVIDFLCLIILIFFGVMTQSRAFLLCFSLLVAIFLVAGKTSIKRKLIRCGVALVALALVVLLVFIVMPTVVENFIKRFQVEDISNHRIELLIYYTKQIFSSFKNAMFGIGLQNIGQKLLSAYKEVEYVTHNGLQQIVIAWGLPGLVMFSVFMFCVIRSALKRVKFSLVNFMPMILIFVDIQFDQFLSEGTTVIMLAASIISINYDFYSNKNENPPKYKNLIFAIFGAIKNPKERFSFFGESKLSRFISPETYYKLSYRARFNKKLTLKNPKTYNEKLQWLKIYDRDTINTVLVDECKARDYVAKKIGEEYLSTQLGVWNRVEDIDFDSLPNEFVLKSNFGANIICNDKLALDVKTFKENFKTLLNKEKTLANKDWLYNNVDKKFIVESLNVGTEQKANKFVSYRVILLNGKANVIQVVSDNFNGDRSVSYYNTSWKRLDVNKNNNLNVAKPSNLSKMLDLSQKLSCDKPILIVEWRLVGDEIKFSKFDLYSSDAFIDFKTNSFDLKLGENIDISKVKTEESSNTKKIVSSLSFKFFEQLAVKGLGLIISIILARLLSPDNFGQLAIMAVFINLSLSLIQSGFGTALIQTKDLSKKDYSTAFYINLLLSITMVAIIFVTAPFIGKFYNSTAIVAPLRFYSLSLLFGAFNSIQTAKLQREMRFKASMYARLFATIASGILGIVFAYLGYGIWALVVYNFSYIVISSFTMLCASRWLPKFEFSKDRAKVLWGFGWKMFVSSLLCSLYDDVRSLVVGKKYSTDDLGYYNRGAQFPMIISTTTESAIQSVMFPVFSKEQDKKERLIAMLERSLSLSCLIIFPIMIGIAIVAKPLVVILLTEKWLPAVDYVYIFCIAYMTKSLTTPNLTAIKAIGRSDIYMKLEIIRRVAMMVVLLISVFCFNSVLAIVIGFAISLWVDVIIISIPMKKLFNFGILKQFKLIWKILLATLIMAIFVYLVGILNINIYLSFTLQILCGIVVYSAVCLLIKEQNFLYLAKMVKKFIKK